jgi:hypothetical protein
LFLQEHRLSMSSFHYQPPRTVVRSSIYPLLW